ncbi:hypothetical protein ACIBJC_15210 [Streptomyces sp. NPDC050509]|uniref:hypothetical protein n=1 Tax=Streptomyces sp. NPDC050509 TaxID=3365620 RepID=UPI00378D3A77
MPTTTIATSAGPITVEATEPLPGLHLYEVPATVSTSSTYRWILALHDGQALAAFRSEHDAAGAVDSITGFADWTQPSAAITTELGASGMKTLTALLTSAGGQHPNT